MAPSGEDAGRVVARVIGLVLGCAACLAVCVVTFGVGGCHDAGGWLCSEEYGSGNTQAYAIAAVFGGLALVCVAAMFTRRRPVLALAFVAGAALLVLAAFLNEGRN